MQYVITAMNAQQLMVWYQKQLQSTVERLRALCGDITKTVTVASFRMARATKTVFVMVSTEKVGRRVLQSFYIYICMPISTLALTRKPIPQKKEAILHLFCCMNTYVYV